VSTVSRAMTELEAANPFPENAALGEWSQADEDALLSFVVTRAGDEREGTPAVARSSPNRRTSRVKWIALPASAAVMAGAVALGLSVTSPGTPRAFAAWTATTTKPPVTQLAAADASCQKAWSVKLIPPAVAQTLPTTLSPLVVTDSRGPFEMLVYAGPSGEQVCLWNKGFIGISGNGGTLPPASSGAIGIPGVGFDGGKERFTYADGQAGPDVTAVTLVLADGTRVEATLKNGLYAAWWPSKTDVSSAEVTTKQGTLQQHFGSIGPNNP
jgi:hypothetical protein